MTDEGGGESWGATGSQMKVGVSLGVLLEVSGSWRHLVPGLGLTGLISLQFMGLSNFLWYYKSKASHLSFPIKVLLY